MKSAKNFQLSVLLCLVIIVFITNEINAAKAKARQIPSPPSALPSSALPIPIDSTEFRLTCTVLVNGAILGGAPGNNAPARRSAKKKKKKKNKKNRNKRSVRVKRESTSKVQLVCDIANKEGTQAAMRYMTLTEIKNGVNRIG